MERQALSSTLTLSRRQVLAGAVGAGVLLAVGPGHGRAQESATPESEAL